MAVPPCPDNCPDGVPYLDWLSFSQLYQEYLTYCALATAAGNYPGPGPFQPLGVYTQTTDSTFVVPADASLVYWDVPGQSGQADIDFSLVQAGQEVTIVVIDSNGFNVTDVGATVFSLNDTSHRIQGIKSNGDGTITRITGTAAQYDVGTSGATVPLLSTANIWSATQRINGALGINASPAGGVDFYVVGTTANGMVAYFRSNSGTFPNTQVVIDAPSNFNPGLDFQENNVNKISFFYNSNTTSGNRLANTLEIYSFAVNDPIVRIHESAPALSLAIDSSGNVTSVSNIEATAPEASNLGFVLKSPDGTRWLIKVDNAGVLSAVAAP